MNSVYRNPKRKSTTICPSSHQENFTGTAGSSFGAAFRVSLPPNFNVMATEPKERPLQRVRNASSLVNEPFEKDFFSTGLESLRRIEGFTFNIVKQNCY